jgi:multidrug efflux pump subunit AcrA (membrane-fusion protein)
MTAVALLTSLLVLQLPAPSTADSPVSPGSDPVVVGLVKVAEHVRLPAREPGVLVNLAVKEGSHVSQGQEIAKIDDSEPQMQKKVAGYKLNAAVKRFQDDVEIEYASKQAAVSEADYEQLQQANKMRERTVTEVDLRRAKLEWDRAVLAIRKARHEQELAKLDAYTQKAELEAADLAIGRRTIVAPFDGIVEELGRKQDEWVNPGDTILRLYRMDTMHVDGAVDQSQYDPHEIQNCEVTVEVKLARGRTETFRGRITRVSSIVQSHGVFNIRAEVANRQQHGTWMLRDGMPCEMTIHLGSGAAAAAGISRAQ